MRRITCFFFGETFRYRTLVRAYAKMAFTRMRRSEVRAFAIVSLLGCLMLTRTVQKSICCSDLLMAVLKVIALLSIRTRRESTAPKTL